MVIEKINTHGFTFAERSLVIRPGSPSSAFLLSNCPGKGCVTLSGTYSLNASDITSLSVEGSDCRPRLEYIEINNATSQYVILTVPPGPACTSVPQAAAGRYVPICHWQAPLGDLSWTGWHKQYTCWSRSGNPFPVGPR